MKKYIIAAAVFAACLALCAAVWPQSDAIEETPVPIQEATISAPEPTVENILAEAEIAPSKEEEKVEILQAEPLHEDIPESEPVPEEVPVVAEVLPEPEAEPAPMPEPAPVLVPSQTVADPQPGDMVYVPGFGWLECQDPGEVIHDESMYENGNKIGVMG